MLNLQKTNKQRSVSSSSSNNNLRNIRKRKIKRQHPLTKASIFSKSTFSWVLDILKLPSTVEFDQSMHYILPKNESCLKNRALFQQQIFEKKKSLISLCFAVFGIHLIEIVLASAVISALTLMFPLLCYRTLELSKQFDDQMLKELVFYFGVFLLTKFLVGLLFTTYKFKFQRLSLIFRYSLASIINDKVLKVKTLCPSFTSTGNVSNLIMSDSEKLGAILPQLYGACVNLFSFLFTYFLSIYLLSWGIMRVISLVYLGLIVGYLITFFVEKWLKKEYLKKKDEKISFLRNIFDHLGGLKLRCRENYFCLKVSDTRETEIRQLENIYIVRSITDCFGWFGTSLIMVILAFLTILSEMQNIEHPKYLTFFLVFAEHLYSFFSLQSRFSFFADFFTSSRRLDNFLQKEPEVKQETKLKDIDNKESHFVLSIKNGNFSWQKPRILKVKNTGVGGSFKDHKSILTTPFKSVHSYKTQELLTRSDKGDSDVISDEEIFVQTNENMLDEPLNTIPQAQYSPRLKPSSTSTPRGFKFSIQNLNIKLKRGEKVVILGKSGSGKSTVLYSLLGETHPLSENVKIIRNGVISLVDETHWLLGSTLAENVILSGGSNTERMNKALRMAQLNPDLKQLKNGLNTVLSNTIDNISAGQRARIAILRSFYQK